MARPATTPDRAAAAREKAQFDSVLAGDLPQPILSLEELPARCQYSTILAAVRIADHHLLQIALGAKQPPVDRIGEEVGHDLRCAPQIIDRLEEWADGNPRLDGRQPVGRRSAILDQPRLFGKDQHCQQVARLVRHADNIGADRLRRDLVENSTGDAQYIERFGRLPVEVCLGRDERSRSRQLCRQPFDPFRLTHRRKAWFETEMARDLVERRCMPLAVLPQVECRKMKVECPHLSHEPADHPGRRDRLVGDEAVPHHAQIFPELFTGPIDRCQCPVSVGQRGNDRQRRTDREQLVRTLDQQARGKFAVTVERVFNPLQNAGQFLAIWLFRKTLRDLRLDLRHLFQIAPNRFTQLRAWCREAL